MLDFQLEGLNSAGEKNMHPIQLHPGLEGVCVLRVQISGVIFSIPLKTSILIHRSCKFFLVMLALNQIWQE